MLPSDKWFLLYLLVGVLVMQVLVFEVMPRVLELVHPVPSPLADDPVPSLLLTPRPTAGPTGTSSSSPASAWRQSPVPGVSSGPAAVSQATATGVPAAAASPAATGSSQALYLTVVNTDGQGVYLRQEAPAGERLKLWPEGTSMRAIGGDRTVDGRLWRQVEDPDGNRGWMPGEYLR